MKLIKMLIITVLTILLTILIVEHLSATTVKDLSKEVATGTVGSLLGGRCGSLTTFVMFHVGAAALFQTAPRGEILEHSAAIGIHVGIPIGGAVGVYMAGNHNGSFLWTVLGSSIPTLISMTCFVIKGENPFVTIHLPPLTDTIENHGKGSILGFRSAMYRGCIGALFSPIGAVIGYELSRSRAPQQQIGQVPQHVAPLYIQLLEVRF
jgi:hypothetical protein